MPPLWLEAQPGRYVSPTIVDLEACQLHGRQLYAAFKFDRVL